MRISVGLGTGNKEQLMKNITGVLALQEKAMMIGATNPEKIYNGLVEYTKAAGFPSPEKFWQKPSATPPPPPPNPAQIMANAEIEKEKIKQAAETQRTQMEIASKE